MVKTDLKTKIKELTVSDFHKVDNHPHYFITGLVVIDVKLFTFKDKHNYEIYISKIDESYPYYTVAIYIMEDEGHGPFERYLYRAIEKTSNLEYALIIANKFYNSV